MEAQCRVEIERAFCIAEKHFGRTIKRVPVTFSKRMTVCAGSAHSKRVNGKIVPSEIRLSVSILAANGAKFVKETPGHEAAHIIADTIFGYDEKPHGEKWQQVMRLIGLKPEVTHSYLTPAKKRQKMFTYQVDGVIKELSLIRHNKLQRKKVFCYQWKDGTIVHRNDWVVL